MLYFAGNDPELDPDRPPSPPTRAIEKPLPRVGKREAPKEAPTAPRGGAAGARGGRGGRVSGNEEGELFPSSLVQRSSTFRLVRGNRLVPYEIIADLSPAFRDRHAGSYNNRNRPIDEQKEAQRRGVRAREDRGGRVRNDRHPRTGET